MQRHKVNAQEAQSEARGPWGPWERRPQPGPRVRTLGHTLCIYHPQIWGPRCAKTQQVRWGVPAQRHVSCPTPRAAVPATPAPCLVSMGPAASPHGHQDLCHNDQSLEGNSDLHRMTAMVKAATWPVAWWAGPRPAEDGAGGRARPRLQKDWSRGPPCLPSRSGAPLSPARPLPSPCPQSFPPEGAQRRKLHPDFSLFLQKS